jgi:hypothetical protein
MILALILLSDYLVCHHCVTDNINAMKRVDFVMGICFTSIPP